MRNIFLILASALSYDFIHNEMRESALTYRYKQLLILCATAAFGQRSDKVEKIMFFWSFTPKKVLALLVIVHLHVKIKNDHKNFFRIHYAMPRLEHTHWSFMYFTPFIRTIQFHLERCEVNTANSLLACWVWSCTKKKRKKEKKVSFG